ncbi:MAG: tryptophan--tRNA ligase [Planctomycetaceae bacterium]|jgi:tryptophanyl-tRNA synthetase|nr:tryptophan--tRNA ligase [Planctomycetaceae bacterium]
MRILSGIQPTGRFHWGNYFGAIRQYIDLQNGQDSAFYFIANLHALTTIRDRELLLRNTYDAALDLLALGLDSERATLFVQSDIHAVTELSWILMTTTPMGLLERCHAYKDKKSKGIVADAGLFTYPVLMAADILLYDSNLVPVGEDQKQHVEVCRDIACSFNHIFGEVFVIPEAYIVRDAAKVAGLDGGKMSKSYGNTVEVFEDLKLQKKKIMGITTDSRPIESPKEPDDDHLFQIYSLFATKEQTQELAARYRRGGFGYGEVKKELVILAESFFAEARKRREEFAAKPEYVERILADGAKRAASKAAEVLERVKKACGISTTKSLKIIPSRYGR